MDYLRETRDRYWGKRDVWVWYIGALGTLGGIVSGLNGLATLDFVGSALGIAQIVISVPYLRLRPWARRGLFAWIPLALVGFVHTLLSQQKQFAGQEDALWGATLGASAMMAVLMTLVLVAIHQSPRNKLAFRVEPSDAELQRLYDRLANSSASRSLAYGLLSLAIPPLSIVGLIAGLHARRKTSKDAWPPQGGQKRAAYGIGFSIASIVLWTTLIVIALMR